jgi:glycopeptide antibiotics resistance protein
VPRILLALSLAGLAVIALWPVPVDRDARGWLSAQIGWLNESGLPWLRYAHVEAAANVALFVPLGILGTLILRRWWLTSLVGIAIAAAIELAQFAALPARVSTISDVLANGLGVTGAALATAAIVRLRSPSRKHSGPRG